ncbi:hypothetical protein BDN70DRAFT_883789 [Pholiota conissans]|uniref:Uncharacterized protein n=1 Tax=Pholiota conissans TaxID=109636 RepID=A0A9P5YT59_9AGAR|nr:hypothetical protein BDN70DRAFT_883789 [Pholiota conissans]
MRIPRHRRPKKTNPTISTLRPDIIISRGEQVYDLSGLNGPVVFAADRKRKGQQNYGRDKTKWLPFPPNTRGYFYYHRSPGQSELASSIRFRLCEGPEDFERGCDLLAPSGKPWGHTLLELAAHPYLEVFSALVLAEGLVDQEIISDLAKYGSQKEQDRSPFLFTLAEPFFYNLALMKENVRILTRKKIIRVDLKMHPFAQQVARPKHHWVSPLTGLVKLRFEISTLPEHVPLGPTLVLRVLEVVEPISMDPDYTRPAVVPPELGTLVYQMRYGKKHIVCLPINRQKMSADILQLAKDTWPDANI